jgi:hypothetical protein
MAKQQRLSHDDIIAEINDLVRQAKVLSDELHTVADHLRGVAVYRRVNIWAGMMAAMTISIGLVLILGGPQRVSSNAYSLVYQLGDDFAGGIFLVCGLLTALCVWRKCHRFMRWALLIEALPFLALAISFTYASVKFPDANLTAGPVYTWISAAHVLLSDFARRENM